MTKGHDVLSVERRVAIALCENGRSSHEYWIGRDKKERSKTPGSDEHDRRWLAYYDFIIAVLEGEYD